MRICPVALVAELGGFPFVEELFAGADLAAASLCGAHAGLGAIANDRKLVIRQHHEYVGDEPSAGGAEVDVFAKRNERDVPFDQRANDSHEVREAAAQAVEGVDEQNVDSSFLDGVPKLVPGWSRVFAAGDAFVDEFPDARSSRDS